MGTRNNTVNTVDISIFQYVEDGFKMITATREVTKFNKAVKAIDECDGLIESLLPNQTACLEKFRERLSDKSSLQMKTWYRICNTARQSSGQWLAEYSLKDFQDALGAAEALTNSEGVAPLMRTVTEADLQDSSSIQQIMHLTHSTDSRSFYKQNRRIKLLLASCDTAIFRTAISGAPSEVKANIERCIEIAKERTPAYSQIIATLTLAQACFRGMRGSETRRALITKAQLAIGDAEIPANLVRMSKTMIADEDESARA